MAQGATAIEIGLDGTAGSGIAGLIMEVPP